MAPGLPPLPPGLNHPLPPAPANMPHISVAAMLGAGSTKHTGQNVATSSATVFAEPQLRDLKKESTAFIPAALKRKKPSAVASASGSKKMKVDAAAAVDVGEPVGPVKPDLMATLKSGLGDRVAATKPYEKPTGKATDDYEAFLAEVGDIL